MDFKIDYVFFDDLARKLASCENAENVVNSVLHNQGGERIRDTAISLLPVSNRSWKGKKKSAKFAQPFNLISSNLAVTVVNKRGYNYLYFPDDGSNTVKHFGNLHFMDKSADLSTNFIVDEILNKILSDFNG